MTTVRGARRWSWSWQVDPAPLRVRA